MQVSPSDKTFFRVTSINPFSSHYFKIYPLRTSEKQRFFDVFRRYIKKNICLKWVNVVDLNQFMPSFITSKKIGPDDFRVFLVKPHETVLKGFNENRSLPFFQKIAASSLHKLTVLNIPAKAVAL